MKYIPKKLLLILLLLHAISASAQQNYILKAKYLMGTMQLTPALINESGIGPLIGGEISWEILPLGDEDYQYYWNFPSWGLALMVFDYGTDHLSGQAINFYPYVAFPLVDTKEFAFKAKVGAGFSIQTQPNNHNSAYFSLFATAAAEATFKLKGGYGFFFEAGIMGMNNCNFSLPANDLIGAYGAAGMRYHIDERRYREPRTRYRRGLPWNIAFNISLAAGIQDYYFYDQHKPLFAAFHINAVRRITNCYAVGGGLDIFYDSKFVPQGERFEESYKEFTEYNRYFIDKNSVAYKLRAGVSINNQLMLGRVTGLLDLGIYLYDPLRNAYAHPHPKHGFERPMIYSYNVNQEDGWFYLQAGARVRLVDHLSAQVLVRAHLTRIECVELGLSYAIPQKRRLQI